MYLIHEIMPNDGDGFFDKIDIEDIKQEIIQTIEKYIDLKLKPVINYFKKKKDFYDISFL